jgi:uncharacterized NAD-dependent epimerase/dehydratase family protein
MRGLPDMPLPEILECIHSNLEAAYLVNKDAKFCGIAVNSSLISEHERFALFDELKEASGLIVFDPMIEGIKEFVDDLLGKTC